MTASPDPAALLAAHVANASFADLPDATVAATKRDLLDTLGCALGGSGAPGIAEMLRLYRRWGGREECRLLLAGGGLPAPQAAFIHAAMAHALDFDDTFDRGGHIHPGAPVFAAALAMADLLDDAHGRDVVLAATLGLDVACRIALAATMDRGWHRTALIGVFGATAVAGKLLKLTTEQMHHAFGIAYSQAAGNRQCIVDAALTKRLQAGQAASAGVFSALLAAEGFTGAQGVFAGRYGFFEMYQPGGYDLAPLTEDLGQAWRGDGMSFKPYPCGRPLHAAIDAAIALHGPDITDVTVSGPAPLIAEYFHGPAHKRAPTQIVEAQFALPFLLAAGLIHGRVGIDDVARFDDPAVLALAARIHGEVRPGPVEITVRRANGNTETRAAALALGSPGNPMSPAQMLAKFQDNAAHAIRPIADDTIAATVAFMSDLDRQPDLRWLSAQLG